MREVTSVDGGATGSVAVVERRRRVVVVGAGFGGLELVKGLADAPVDVVLVAVDVVLVAVEVVLVAVEVPPVQTRRE